MYALEVGRLSAAAGDLPKFNPDRGVIAEARLARDRFSIDAPVRDSSLGRCIPKHMIELVGAALRCEERLLLFGKEPRPQVARSSVRPDLAQASVPAGEPADVVHALGAVQVAAPEERLAAEEVMELE